MMGGIFGGNMTYSRKLMRLKSFIYGYNMVVITHPTPPFANCLQKPAVAAFAARGMEGILFHGLYAHG